MFLYLIFFSQSISYVIKEKLRNLERERFCTFTECESGSSLRPNRVTDLLRQTFDLKKVKMATPSRRPRNSTISTIFFDLDNTLIPTRKGDKIACDKVQSILVERYGFSTEVANHVTQNFLRNFRKCPESLDMELDEWRHLLWKKALGEQLAGISGDIYLQWLRLRYKYLAPSEEVLNLLESLQKNYYLAIITNGPSKSQWEKINRLDLGGYFHCILVSGDLPWEKPNKKIFLEACMQLNVMPEECIMIGDKIETDILGAIKASLGGSVWIPLNESNVLNNNINTNNLIKPDHTISDVSQLPYLLPPVTKFTNSRFLTVFSPDFEDCNSNSSDGS